jgi:hypothetical protein
VVRRQIVFWSGISLLGLAAILYGLARPSSVRWEVIGLGIVMLLCVALFGITIWLYRGQRSPYRGRPFPYRRGRSR